MSRSRGTGIAVASLILLEIVIWLSLVVGTGLFRRGPDGRTLSADFAVFLAGARVLQNGGNPYDGKQLFATEHRMLGRQHLAGPADPRQVRLANPPILYWALQPLTSTPYRPTALAWIGLMYGLAACGFVCLLLPAGRAVLLPGLVISLLMPQVVLAAAYGNLTCLIFAAIVGARALVVRLPSAAGLFLTFAWLKPQIGLPAALIVGLLDARRMAAIASGFLAGTLLLLGATLSAVGWATISDWIHGVGTFGAGISLQTNLASLSGLYASWAPSGLTSILQAVFVMLALLLTWIAWRQKGDRGGAPAWLWFVWFLATPYAHFPDEILLAIPIAALFMGDLWRRLRLPVVTLYTMFFSIVLFASISGISLLPIPLAAIGIALYLKSREEKRASQPIPAGVQ